MAHKSTYKTKFRRRRQGKTDYVRRLNLLKSQKPRLVVRKSNKQVFVQFEEFGRNGDKVLEKAVSRELKTYGWNLSNSNTSAAYLTGFLAGKKFLKKLGKKEVFLDIGLNTPVHGSKIFSALKGAVDSGIQVKFDEKAFPKQDRIEGKHIEEYAKMLGEDAKKKFSEYYKKGVDPSKISEYFAKTKKSIEEGFK